MNRSTISIIVPAHNNPDDLQQCLAALQSTDRTDSEIIVVDDASTDHTPSIAAAMGVRVLELAKNSGPAAARNYGAHHAKGDILLFVDADIVLAPGAVNQVMRLFEQSPEFAAIFGSYDTRPRAKGLVAQYRNLLHHFVHQRGNPKASTFWAGCGAVRRRVFEEIGGFDEKRFPFPSIEDIELGYRLRKAGHQILLDKSLQGTHLKHWSLGSVIRTDITCRAIPWSRLILEDGKVPNDLNLKWGQRLSAFLVVLSCVFIGLSVFFDIMLSLAAAALLGVLILNRELYWFFYRQRGLFFAAVAVALHLLYYLYSTLSYAYVWTEYHLKGLARAFAR